MTVAVDAGRTGFAPDPRLPSRDALLDADAVAERVSGSVGLNGPVPIDTCTLVRAKYRIGESLRVVYRVTIGGDARLLTARAFADGASAVAYGKALARAVPAGGLRPVVHDVELDAVWWTFPNDRRLTGLGDMSRPPASVAALAGGPTPWVDSEVVEYAPERSLTVRAMAATGVTVAFAKAYGPGGPDVDELAARYDHVAAGLDRSGRDVSSPRALGWCCERGLLVLEPMPGLPWSALDDHAAPAALRRLGEAIALVHALEPPVGIRPFGRLTAERLAHSAELVARARPDIGPAVLALTAGLVSAAPSGDERRLLHGDCHPKNVLFAGGELSLLDLDQSGVGAAAADVGSLLARLRHGQCLAERDEVTSVAMAGAFLEGYAGVRPLPGEASLRWHTAAALIAERALRAVNRVHRPALGRLDLLLDMTERTVRERAWP